MTANFSNLFEGLAITDTTVKPYRFSVLPDTIVCHFKPGTEDNKQYASALLALSDKRARRNRRGSKSKKATPASIKRVRSENTILIARYCLVGWEGMTYQNEDGSEGTEFTTAVGLNFLEQLPHYIFDELFAWLQDPMNFIDEDDDDDDYDDEDVLTLDNIDDLVNVTDENAEPDEVETLGKPLENTSSGA